MRAAGVTSIPKTPTEFLDALQKVRDYDPSIDPLYTNYAAGWTMSAWDAYIGGGATGDPDWMGIVMPQTMDPFSPGVPTGDPESGPYAVYNILYEAVKRGLTEADPTTTDWEGSKTRMNNGHRRHHHLHLPAVLREPVPHPGRKRHPGRLHLLRCLFQDPAASAQAGHRHQRHPQGRGHTYNEYYMANLYLQDKTRYQVVSTSLYVFSGPMGSQYNYICAGVIITIIPALIIFLLCQDQIYSGMAAGAVKG